MQQIQPNAINVNNHTHHPSTPSPPSPSLSTTSSNDDELGDDVNGFDFLGDRGGSEQFNLKTEMGDVPDKEQTIQSMAMSKYVTSQGLQNFLYERKGEFSIMTLNAQNLYSKHTKLLLLTRLLESRGCAISAICVQECFFSNNNLTEELIQLPNYELIPQRSKMGRNHGLAIYLHKDFKYVVRHPLCFTSEDLDALVIDVKGDSMKKDTTL